MKNDTEARLAIEIPLRDRLKKELEEMIIPHIKRIQQLCNALYSCNIVYPKYRNLVAVTQICEYLESGRSNRLDGPHGAYNLFESELRQNIVILELDAIRRQLQALSRTGSMGNMIKVVNDTRTLVGSINKEGAVKKYYLACVEAWKAFYNTGNRGG